MSEECETKKFLVMLRTKADAEHKIKRLANRLDTDEVIAFSKEVNQMHEELITHVDNAVERYSDAYIRFSEPLYNAWQSSRGGWRSDFYTEENRIELRTLTCCIIFLVDYKNGTVWESDVEKVAHSRQLFGSYHVSDKFTSVAKERCIRYGGINEIGFRPE